MTALLHGAPAMSFFVVLAIAGAVWALSLPLRDVSIVDIAWGWLVAAPGVVFAAASPPRARGGVVLAIALAWALRLSLHIARRHRGRHEDRRYQAIRARNGPNFALKSLYLVFGLQAVLACVVALPVVAAVAADTSWRPLDAAGLTLALFGFFFEAIADTQLAQFTAKPRNRTHVMQSGLWRYSRHPNYFGEFCLWWGLGIVAAAGGAWWALASPGVMTFLLLRVSGVTLLESDLGTRRPAYPDYMRRTSAFIPRSPRS